jgi:hypothetical protein
MLIEALAGNVFHGEVGRPVFWAWVQDPNKVRVVEEGPKPRFQPEARSEFFIVHAMRVGQLERHLLSGGPVPGEVGIRESASAQETLQPVGTYNLGRRA